MFRKRIEPILISSIATFVILLEIIIGYSFDYLDFSFFFFPTIGAISCALILILEIVFMAKDKKVELIDLINILICIALIASFIYTAIYSFAYSFTQSDYPSYNRIRYEFPGIFKLFSGNAKNPGDIPELSYKGIKFVSFDFYILLVLLISYGSYYISKFVSSKKKRK